MEPEPVAEAEPSEVVLHLSPAAPQSRLTIFFRLVLVIPQYIVLYFFSLFATLAGMVGWLVALFTGRLPAGIDEVLRTWTRTTAQVWGYLTLLSGQWPPVVARDDSEYDVDVRFPPPQRLNRLAVLFRFVLLIPAAIVTMFLMVGFLVLSFFFWLIALAKGRLPESVHQANGAVLRYAIRYNAYAWMLTPAYPKGLFGGRTLRLTAGAKRLVAVFLVLGALTYGGSIVAAVVFGDFEGIAARTDVNAAYGQFAEDTAGLNERMNSCPEQPDPLKCATASMNTLAVALSRFHDQAVVIEYPPTAADEGAELAAAIVAFRNAAQRLAAARSPDEYRATAEQTRFDELGTRVDQAYTNVLAAL